jgi:hypothetical protein
MAFIRPGRSSASVATDPYPHYTAFDRNIVPWHTGSGGWGAQVTLESPALPVTNRSVTVSTAGAFNTEASVAGSLITIDTTIADTNVLVINASDIDVIIPPGVNVGLIDFGSFPRTTAIARVRIRGNTPYVRSGGMFGTLRILPSTLHIYTDIVIDSLDMDGKGPGGGIEREVNIFANVNRMCVVNCRLIAAGWNWLSKTESDSCRHVVIANCNFASGQAARAELSFAEGWSIRGYGGPFTIIDSRIQTTRYHAIRLASRDTVGELLYVGNSTLVTVSEGKTAWAWNNLGGSEGFPTAEGDGAIFTGCNIYAYSECSGPAEINTTNVAFATISNNNFYSGGSATWAQGTVDGYVKGGGVGTGNTFNALGSLPAWSAVGNPTSITLPYSRTLITGEGTCVAGA